MQTIQNAFLQRQPAACPSTTSRDAAGNHCGCLARCSRLATGLERQALVVIELILGIVWRDHPVSLFSAAASSGRSSVRAHEARISGFGGLSVYRPYSID
jgi:hypothetical protein